MRDVDLALVEYFKVTYGPFSCKVIQNKHVHSEDPMIENDEIVELSLGRDIRKRAHKCDFCGNLDAVKVARCESVHVQKALFICMECPTLEILLGKDAVDELLFDAINQADGLVQFPAGQEEFARAAQDAKKLQELIGQGKVLETTKTPPDKVKELVDIARNYQKIGLGKGWVILPNLIAQYDQKGRLTEKQIDVIVRHNKACLDHVNKRKL